MSACGKLNSEKSWVCVDCGAKLPLSGQRPPAPLPLPDAVDTKAQKSQENAQKFQELEERLKKQENEERLKRGVVFAMQGHGEVLEVFEDKVVIMPKGIVGFFDQRGKREIPFHSISAVQLHESSKAYGYISFDAGVQTGIIGSLNTGPAGILASVIDRNRFTFIDIDKKNNVLAREIKTYIDLAVQKLKLPEANLPTTSLAEELQKLAQLKGQGLLSDEEFDSAKRKLLE